MDRGPPQFRPLSLHAALRILVRHMVVDDPAEPLAAAGPDVLVVLGARLPPADPASCRALVDRLDAAGTDRKSTRLNSSHANISYAVFCLKKKNHTRACQA